MYLIGLFWGVHKITSVKHLSQDLVHNDIWQLLYYPHFKRWGLKFRASIWSSWDLNPHPPNMKPLLFPLSPTDRDIEGGHIRSLECSNRESLEETMQPLPPYLCPVKWQVITPTACLQALSPTCFWTPRPGAAPAEGTFVCEWRTGVI